jgi:hypothetical protein
LAIAQENAARPDLGLLPVGFIQSKEKLAQAHDVGLWEQESISRESDTEPSQIAWTGDTKTRLIYSSPATLMRLRLGGNEFGWWLKID